MQNTLHYIHKYPHRTKGILGIDFEQFQELLKQLELKHIQQQTELEKQKIRVNAKGGGRNPLLSIAEQVCLCLLYLRHYPTFEILGIQFGVSKTEANDTFHYWRKLLRDILPSSLLEQVESNDSDYEMVKECLTQFQLIVDSFEQARERPGDNEVQRTFYSGKKKQHTFKSQVISLPGGTDIVDAVAGARGPMSDINLFRTRESKFSPEQRFDGDKAYVNHPKVTTPHKKPNGGKLTAEQKAENKEFSGTRRIFIEHVIRLLKIFRVTKERFRLHHDTYEEIILTVCGLVRFRLGMIVFPHSSQS